MITLFEEYDPDETFDNNGKFILVGKYDEWYTYKFVWNIRLIKNKYQSQAIGFTYNKKSNILKIDDINKNEIFEFYIVESRINPIKFYRENPKLCLLLFNEIKEKLNKFPEMASFRNIKYNKLLNTLYNIDDLRMYIETDKYNL